MKLRSTRPQSAKVTYGNYSNPNPISSDLAFASRTVKFSNEKSQNQIKNFEIKESSMEKLFSPSRNKLKFNGLLSSTQKNWEWQQKDSLSSLFLLDSNRIIDNLGGYGTNKKKELYVNQISLKKKYHLVQDQNLKLKSSVGKMEERISQLKRQLMDYKVLEQYAEPLFKDTPTLSPQKQKQNEFISIISNLKRDIRNCKDELSSKGQEIEDIKKMIRQSDEREIILEKRILANSSIDTKLLLESQVLENQICNLLTNKESNLIGQLLDSRIFELQCQNKQLSEFRSRQVTATEKIQEKQQRAQGVIQGIRRQISELEARLKVVKEGKKQKREEQSPQPGVLQTPKERTEQRILEESAQKVQIEFIRLTQQLQAVKIGESTKQKQVDQSKAYYQKSFEDLTAQNYDFRNQILSLQKQNLEYDLKIQTKEPSRIEGEIDKEADIEQQIRLIQNQKSIATSENKIGTTHMIRKSSINSQKSSDRDSLNYTNSKYGTSTIQRAISVYSPFQNTNYQKVGIPGIEDSNIDAPDSGRFQKGGLNDSPVCPRSKFKEQGSEFIPQLKQGSEFIPQLKQGQIQIDSNIQLDQSNFENPRFEEFGDNDEQMYPQNEDFKKSPFTEIDVKKDESEFDIDYGSHHSVSQQLPSFQSENRNEYELKSSSSKSQQDQSKISNLNEDPKCFPEENGFLWEIQKNMDLEKECAKYEKLISRGEVINFPNPGNIINSLYFEQTAHEVILSLFGFDYKEFQGNWKQKRVEASKKIQERVISFLKDTDNLQNPYERSSQFKQVPLSISKITFETHRFDHSVPVKDVILSMPSIANKLSVNTISLPGLRNESFDFIDRFQIGNKEAYRAVIKRTSQVCTLISSPVETSHQLENILKEIEIQLTINSPYLMKPLCCYVDYEGDKIYLNSISVPLIGNLSDFLEKYEVQDSERINMCYQLGQAVQSLHRAGIIHTQISPQNININDNFVPLLTGFKNASTLKVENGDGENWVLMKSNSWTQKNEFSHQQLNGKYDFSFDIYTLGLIFYYLLSKQNLSFEFNDNLTFEEVHSFSGFSNLQEPFQRIIQLCIEKSTSLDGILFEISKQIDQTELQEIRNQAASMNILSQEDTPIKQSEAFFDKGRLICEIKNGQIDNNGMFFSTKTGFQGQILGQMECLVGHFKGENIKGKSISIKQDEPFIEYMRDQNDNTIYVYDRNIEELTKCHLFEHLPIVTGELEEPFLQTICASKILNTQDSIILPDKTEIIMNKKTHTLNLKSETLGEIEYSPTGVKFRLASSKHSHNSGFTLGESSKTFMFSYLNSSLRIILPSVSSKEKIYLNSPEFFFELNNVDSFFILTLSLQMNETQPITVILDANFLLNSFLPQESSIRISNIPLETGFLGIITNQKHYSVILGIFKSYDKEEVPILIKGFKISKEKVSFLENQSIEE